MRRLIYTVTAYFVFAAFTVAGYAADQFILRGPQKKLEQVIPAVGLRVLQKVENRQIFLTEGPSGLTPERVIELVLSIGNVPQPGCGDDDDDDDDDDCAPVAIELNRIVTLPGVGSGTPPASGYDAVNKLLGERATVNYFGARVWSGFVRQPLVSYLELQKVHSRFGTGSGTVAVIDTGVDPNHPALRNALEKGADFVNNLKDSASELRDLDPFNQGVINPSTTSILDFAPSGDLSLPGLRWGIWGDPGYAWLNSATLPEAYGHGTMVAGLVRLVAPGAKILPVKAFDGTGRGSLFQVVQSIYFAIDKGANVVNMSFSFPAHSAELMRAVSEATERGLICIASAGNEGLRTLSYPAAYSNVIGVAATDLNDKLSPFTNYGDALVSLAAPGEALVTPFPGGQYAVGWGSSYSAPVVAGAAALLRRMNSGAGHSDAAAVFSRAKPLTGGYGWGRLLIFEALERSERIK